MNKPMNEPTMMHEYVDDVMGARTVSELIEMLTSIQIVYGDVPIDFDAGYNNINVWVTLE